MNNFEFELGNDINLGKVSANDFKESKSIGLLKEILESNNKIKVRSTEADKIPDLDGSINLLDNVGHERIKVEIQSKTLPIEYNSTTPYFYDCDTKVFNVVKFDKTFNIVVLFLSDILNKKIFYKIVTKEYIEELNYGNQETKRIKFDENDLYDEDKFMKKIKIEAESKSIIINKGKEALVTSYENGPNIYYRVMQEEIDKVNNRFDNELKIIKKVLFPQVWKFGIAYNKTVDGFVLGIYKIYKGQNDTLVKNFNIRSNYMNMKFYKMSSENISTVLNKWVDECINQFYNVYFLEPKYCSNEVLFEIVFDFLDNLAYLADEIKNKNNRNYFKNEEKVDTIRSYINGLSNFYKAIWNEKEKHKVTCLLEPAYKVTKKFIIFNPFITFKEEHEMLLKYLLKEDHAPFEENIFLDKNVNMSLVMLAVEELEKRKIKTVHRLYSRDKNNYIKTIFNMLDKSYIFTKEKLKLNNNQVIKGEFCIYYCINTNIDFIVKYKPQNKIEVKCEMLSEREFLQIKDNFEQIGIMKSFGRIRIPLYEITKLLINKGCMEAQGKKFKFKSENFYIFDMNEFPILTFKYKE